MGFINAPLKGSKAHPEHPIQLTSSDTGFHCDGCGEPSIGLCYQCKDPSGECGEVFHVECGRPDEITSHPFSKGCQFTFKYSRPDKDGSSAQANTKAHRICDACCTDIKGFYYVCHKHDKPDGHFIHPSCMKLQNRILVGGFQLELKGTVPGKCGLCEHMHAFNNLKGWSYVSTCGSQSMCLHIKCVKKMFMEEWTNTLFPDTSAPGAARLTNIAGGSTSNSGQGQPILLLKGSGGTSFSIKKSATKVVKLLKVAVPVIVSAMFGKSVKKHAGVIIETLTADQ